MGKDLAKQWEAYRGVTVSRNAATRNILKAACKVVPAAVETGIYAHLKRYPTGVD